MLLHIPEVLTRDQVAGFRRKLEQADWTEGRETVGHLGAQVNSNKKLPEFSQLRREMCEAILTVLAKHLLFFSAVLPLTSLPPRFNRYAGVGTYGFLDDGAVMDLSKGKQLR